MNWKWISNKIDKALDVNNEEEEKKGEVKEDFGDDFEEFPSKVGSMSSKASDHPSDFSSSSRLQESEGVKSPSNKSGVSSSHDGKNESDHFSANMSDHQSSSVAVNEDNSNAQASDHNTTDFSHASDGEVTESPSIPPSITAIFDEILEKKDVAPLIGIHKELKTRELQLLEKSKQIQTLLQSNESLKNEVRNLRSKPEAVRLRKDLKSKEVEYKELMEEGKELSIEVGKLNERNRKLRNQLKTTEGELENAKTEIQKQKDDLKTKVVSDRSNLESEIMKIEKRYKLKITEFETRITDLIGSNKSKESQYKQNSERMKREFAEKEKEYLKTITSFQVTLQQQSQESGVRIGAMGREIQDLLRIKEERSEVETENVIQKIETQSMKECLKKISELEKKAEYNKKEWGMIKSTLELQKRELEQKISLQNLTIENVREKLNGMRIERERISGDKKKYEDIARIWRSERKKLLAEMERLRQANQDILGQKQDWERSENDLKKKVLLLSRNISMTPKKEREEYPDDDEEEEKEKKVIVVHDDNDDSNNSDDDYYDSDEVVIIDDTEKNTVKKKKKNKNKNKNKNSAEYVPSEFSSEFVKLKKTNQVLLKELGAMDDLRMDLMNMKVRYNTAKEIIADKNDNIRVLNEDFKYVKKMFQNQTIQLLGEIEKLKQKKKSTVEI